MFLLLVEFLDQTHHPPQHISWPFGVVVSLENLQIFVLSSEQVMQFLRIPLID